MALECDFLDLVKDNLASEIFPGASFAFVTESKESRWTLGYAALYPKKTLLRPEMMWDLASVSKVVGVGTVLINRILEDNLDIDSSLRTHYPAWHEDTVTLRQLLTHTSGIDPYIPGRDSLDFNGLVEAVNHLKVTADKTFRYTDVNFILLGLMLEAISGQGLEEVVKTDVFDRFEMKETKFGPVFDAVATSHDIPVGQVHDPKAQVLGPHAGSAGLFSTLSDLIAFVRGYFANPNYFQLLSNFSKGIKPRSLAWDLLEGGWLLHTGYTGTFLLIHLRRKEALIFLSNRVHQRDDRENWILRRDSLIQTFIQMIENGSLIK